MSKEKTNCPNCGAPIGAFGVECPYCGTKYYDFSDIPIGEPFHIRVRTKDGIYITCPVIVRQFSVTNTPEYTECTGYAWGAGNVINRIVQTGNHIEIEMSMESA